MQKRTSTKLIFHSIFPPIYRKCIQAEQRNRISIQHGTHKMEVFIDNFPSYRVLAKFIYDGMGSSGVDN